MSTGYLRFTVLPSCEPKMHSCSLQLSYPLGGKQQCIGREGYPFPALCILNLQLRAGASLLIRCSRVPGSATPPYPSQLAWVFANSVIQILIVYITNALDLRARSKSDARGGEREGYDRTVSTQVGRNVYRTCQTSASSILPSVRGTHWAACLQVYSSTTSKAPVADTERC